VVTARSGLGDGVPAAPLMMERNNGKLKAEIVQAQTRNGRAFPQPRGLVDYDYD
jgi:hypothetical protein